MYFKCVFWYVYCVKYENLFEMQKQEFTDVMETAKN